MHRTKIEQRLTGIFRPKCFIFLLILLVYSLPQPQAQQNQTLYFMSQVPQASVVNPAYPAECTYLGIPLVSSVHANLGHTGFSFNQIFPEKGASRIVDFNYLEHRLHRYDLFNAQGHFDIFSLGMPWRDYFFTFRITEKAVGMMHYPKELFLLPWKGNREYIGQTKAIERMGGHFSHYREYSLGMSGWLSDALRGGIRARLLFGKMNLNTRHESIKLTTRSINYDIDVRGHYRINTSLPLEFTTDSNGLVTQARIKDDATWEKVLLNRKNPGLGLDLGVIYTGWENITLYASLLNMGWIHWSSDLKNFDVQQDFQFEGLDQEDLDMDDYLGMMRDSLADSYDITQSRRPYTTFLPVHSYLGMTYRLHDHLKAGILQHNILYKWRIYPSFTLSLNMQPVDFLSVHASYSYNNYSFRNLGAGISFQTDRWQFYAASDNLLAVRPLNVRNVNFRFGLNLFFGCAGGRDASAPQQPASGPGCFWIKRHQEVKKILPQK